MNAKYTRDGDLDEFIAIKSAIIELDQALKTRFEGTDPAPWVDADYDPLERKPFDVKVAVLARRLLLTALLDGSLSGTFGDCADLPNVPGWAWAKPNYVRHCFGDGHLRLSPLLPAEWQALSCKPVWLKRSFFTSWMRGLANLSSETETALPTAFDADNRPLTVSTREPTKSSWVSLAEAASWVAFYVSLGGYELELGLDAAETSELVEPRFSDVVQGLAALLDAGNIEPPSVRFTGRYSPQYFGNYPQADSKLIATQELLNFRQPDWLRNGLFRDPTIPHNRGSGDNDVRGNHLDGYKDVHVAWVNLMVTFPPRARAPNNRATHDEILSWCQKWQADPKTPNGQTPAWEVFRLIARSEGQSRDDSFRPVWNEAKTKR